MPKETRCAIYTRKSTEEGLEQDFNSLDAQQEACEAFIKSQQHEGWQVIKTTYNDGGFSGGNMERPALKQLMTDIKAGLIDTIVVYKIDRLTRSLADFAKMVDVFDAHKVSFVSVTQQFNTTSSMGRLTLNVLLSFAQFEREVTAERIRDKVAASKAKGMWMGGAVPLGYKSEERQLVPNAKEAKLVRHIFEEYLRLESVEKLRNQLNNAGQCTRGGKRFHTGHLANILTNPVYIGKIKHKEKVYPGNHKPIISQEIWERVQTLRQKSIRRHTHRVRAKDPSLLAGKLFDAAGHPMSPIHANKNGRRYRYYISQAEVQGKALAEDTIARVPAAELENTLFQYIQKLLHQDDKISHIINEPSPFIRQRGRELAEHWKKLKPSDQHVMMRTLLAKVVLEKTQIGIHISRQGLTAVLKGEKYTTQPSDDDVIHFLSIKLKPVAGGATYIFGEGKVESRAQNKELLRAVARAVTGNQMLIERKISSQQELAQHFKVDERQWRRTLPLAWLAPDIITLILEGKQPVDWTIQKLREAAKHPCWQAQRQFLQIQA